jgi:sirohydrochlorin ferrochelatase
VDHGSRRSEANAVLEHLVAVLRQRTGLMVYAAHMDLASPSVADAFARAKAEGADSLIVVPYFLTPGKHSEEDIPVSCAAAAARHSDIKWRCTPALGVDPRMLDLVRDRLAQEGHDEEDEDS